MLTKLYCHVPANEHSVQDDTEILLATRLRGVNRLSNEGVTQLCDDFTEAVLPCTANEQSGHFWGHVIAMDNNQEFPMQSSVLGIGSTRSNSIIVKDAAAHEVLLEVNMYRKVFLIRGGENDVDLHQLKDSEVFKVGTLNFEWTYKVQGQKASQIQQLSDEQSQLLHDIFKANISLRRELKMMDCINAVQRYKCLSELSWKKIKNTVHNWIMAEKRKTKLFKHKA